MGGREERVGESRRWEGGSFRFGREHLVRIIKGCRGDGERG